MHLTDTTHIHDASALTAVAVWRVYTWMASFTPCGSPARASWSWQN